LSGMSQMRSTTATLYSWTEARFFSRRADLLMVESKFASANPEDDVAVVESEDGMLRIVAPEFK